jgi:hypothetical protein
MKQKVLLLHTLQMKKLRLVYWSRVIVEPWFTAGIWP